MKKILAILLAMVCGLTVVSCGSSESVKPEIYQSRSAYVEAGYEGDVVDDVTTTLVLHDDGTYTNIENTSIVQVAGIVVAYWTYTMEGTYTVDSSDSATKTVTLSDATAVEYNINGSVSTNKDDSALLDYGKGKTVTIDLVSNTISQ